MPVATFPLGPLGTNSYVLNNGETAVTVDVGGDPAEILDYLRGNNLRLEAILITHRHFDHLFGVADLAAATKAPVYVPRGEDILANTESSRGGIWGMPSVKPFEALPLPTGRTTFAGLECIVLETPGHTPGGVSLYFPQDRIVFTGDTLFYRSLGRSDFPGGSHQQLLKSIHEKLFTLPDDVTVYPGHGPETTIGEEREHNPFCGKFAI